VVSSDEIKRRLEEKRRGELLPDRQAKICPNCGTENPDDANFCEECGRDLNDIEKAVPPKEAPKNMVDRIKEWWDKQSTGGKAAIGIATCCLGALLFIGIVGMMAPETTITEPTTTTESMAATKLIITSPKDGETVKGVDKVIIKGYSEPNATVTINGKNVTLETDGNFTYEVLVKMGMNTIKISAKAPGKSTTTLKGDIMRVESEDEYKASCKTTSFNELDKNPDKYAGQRVVYTGRVIQIMEDFGTTDIRMDVNDVFGDTIYVTFDGTTSAVEDSMITVYGEVYGSYTYESVAGYQITLPRITAKYIDVL